MLEAAGRFNRPDGAEGTMEHPGPQEEDRRPGDRTGLRGFYGMEDARERHPLSDGDRVHGKGEGQAAEFGFQGMLHSHNKRHEGE